MSRSSIDPTRVRQVLGRPGVLDDISTRLRLAGVDGRRLAGDLHRLRWATGRCPARVRRRGPLITDDAPRPEYFLLRGLAEGSIGEPFFSLDRGGPLATMTSGIPTGGPMTARTIPLARPLLGSTLPFALPIGLVRVPVVQRRAAVGRLVLPVFGGTPAVWATVLFFFQGVLLVGYLYGHVSVTRLGPLGAAAPPGPGRPRLRGAARGARSGRGSAERGDPAGARPHPDPAGARRPAGARADHDDAAGRGLVRGLAIARDRRRRRTGCTRSATAARCSPCWPTRSSSSRGSA